MPGLHWCAQVFSSCGKPGSLVAVGRLLIAAVSLVVKHRLQGIGSVVAERRLGCPIARGILVPRPGIKHVSLVLTGGFLITGPPGKSPEGSVEDRKR